MGKIDLPVPFRTIILDAGPIIHPDELGCLSLLSDFDELLVPDAVWEEVEHHRPAALTAQVSLSRKVMQVLFRIMYSPCVTHSTSTGEKQRHFRYVSPIPRLCC